MSLLDHSRWHRKTNVSVGSLKTGKSPCPCLEAIGWEEFLFFQGKVSFFGATQPLDWLGQAHHPGEGTLLYSVYNANVKLIQKHPQDTDQSGVQPNVKTPCGPVKWHIKVSITTPPPSLADEKAKTLSSQERLDSEEQTPREDKHASDPVRKGPYLLPLPPTSTLHELTQLFSKVTMPWPMESCVSPCT